MWKITANFLFLPFSPVWERVRKGKDAAPSCQTTSVSGDGVHLRNLKVEKNAPGVLLKQLPGVEDCWFHCSKFEKIPPVSIGWQSPP